MSAKEHAVSKETTKKLMAILKRKRADLKKAKKEAAALRKALATAEKKSHTETDMLRVTHARPKKKVANSKSTKKKA